LNRFATPNQHPSIFDFGFLILDWGIWISVLRPQSRSKAAASQDYPAISGIDARRPLLLPRRKRALGPCFYVLCVLCGSLFSPLVSALPRWNLVVETALRRRLHSIVAPVK
jgi:hypothetical protein